MKTFHISDILSVTTDRLVSSRHIDGVYAILNFLTGDELFTPQLPRAIDECQPWLRAQFPTLFPDNQIMAELLDELDAMLKAHESKKARSAAVDKWVQLACGALGVPEHLPVYEMPEDEHTYIDALEELRAMKGDDRVTVVVTPDDA